MIKCPFEVSPVPASCLELAPVSDLTAELPADDVRARVPVVMGIDEAGRGPVLGSMVYACAYWPQSMDAKLSSMGFDDSKAITEAKRESLFRSLKANGNIGYAIARLTAPFISAKMLQRSPYSLNAMSHDTAIDLIRAVVDAGVNVVHVYVDTVGDAGYYDSKLRRAFHNSINFTVSKKADSLYKVVSAASIAAKVTRDSDLRAIAASVAGAPVAPDVTPVHAGKRARVEEQEEGEDPEDAEDVRGGAAVSKQAVIPMHATVSRACAGMTMGSGYPGDALTKTWLTANFHPLFGWPQPLARFSWATAKDMFDAVGVEVEWEEDEAAVAGAAHGREKGAATWRSSKMTSFFAASAAPTARGGSAGSSVASVGRDVASTVPFFRKRALQRVHAM